MSRRLPLLAALGAALLATPALAAEPKPVSTSCSVFCFGERYPVCQVYCWPLLDAEDHDPQRLQPRDPRQPFQLPPIRSRQDPCPREGGMVFPCR